MEAQEEAERPRPRLEKENGKETTLLYTHSVTMWPLSRNALHTAAFGVRRGRS